LRLILPAGFSIVVYFIYFHYNYIIKSLSGYIFCNSVLCYTFKVPMINNEKHCKLNQISNSLFESEFDGHEICTTLASPPQKNILSKDKSNILNLFDFHTWELYLRWGLTYELKNILDCWECVFLLLFWRNHVGRTCMWGGGMLNNTNIFFWRI